MNNSCIQMPTLSIRNPEIPQPIANDFQTVHHTGGLKSSRLKLNSASLFCFDWISR
jgi:hypothetical protein